MHASIFRGGWLLMALAVLASAARGADFHHVHLNSTDPVAAAKWYAEHFGGEVKKVGIFSATGFDRVVFIYFKAKPGFAGSAGSVVDHIGFSVPDVDAKLAALRQAGVKVVAEVAGAGPLRSAFVEDPWGTKIEIVDDPQIQGFHHVHLVSVAPEETLAWYTSSFGGQVSRFAGQTPGIRYGDMWLLVDQVAEAPAATKGRAVDHISWGFQDLPGESARLKTQGVTFTTEPVRFGSGMIAFVVDPAGVLIELVGPAKAD